MSTNRLFGNSNIIISLLIALLLIVTVLPTASPASLLTETSVESQFGFITGTVTDGHSGRPVRAINVWIYPVTQYGSMDPTRSNVVTQTNQEGVFSTQHLYPGFYKVHYVPQQSSPYLETWYEDKEGVLEANIISLEAGDTYVADSVLENISSIYGRITAADTGEPLSNFFVYALPVFSDGTLDSSKNYSLTYSDQEGNYWFSSLSAGYYRVSISMRFEDTEFYMPEQFDDAHAGETATIIHLSGPDSGPIRADAALESPGTVFGTLVDELTRQPLAGAMVWAFPVTEDGTWTQKRSQMHTYTNADGTFEIKRMYGDYKLEFRPPPNSLNTMEYYNNAYSWDLATHISVASKDRLEVNADLSATGIQGTITSKASGLPLPGIDVVAYPVDSTGKSDNRQQYVYGTSDQDGKYVMPGLTEGFFKLYFKPPSGSEYYPEYYDNAAVSSTASMIAIELGKPKIIDVSLDSNPSFQGQVTNNQGTPLPGINITAYAVRQDGEIDTSRPSRYAITDSAGTYTIPAMKVGLYKLLFDPPADSNYLNQYYNNAFSWTEATLINAALSTIQQLNVTLSSNSAINGKISGGTGDNYLKDVRVYLYPVKSDGSSDYSRSGRGVSTDANGYYQLTKLTPGQYKLRLTPVDTRYAAEYYNGKDTLAAADFVTISPGETLTLNQTLRLADKVAPETTIGLAGEKNGEWFKSGVTITLDAVDNQGGSGVAFTRYSLNGITWNYYSGPFQITQDGIYSLRFRSLDLAANGEEPKTVEIKIDQTPPVVTVNSPTDGAQYVLNSVITAEWSAIDSLSGINEANGSEIDTNTVGTKTFTVTAEDLAGNETTLVRTYLVVYQYIGNSGPKNTSKLGAVKPIKFQLQDARGDNISSATALLWVAQVNEDGTTGPEAAAVSSGTGGNNEFRYDTKEKQYIYNLNTKVLGLGTWQLRIRLDDGTTQYLFLNINK